MVHGWLGLKWGPPTRLFLDPDQGHAGKAGLIGGYGRYGWYIFIMAGIAGIVWLVWQYGTGQAEVNPAGFTPYIGNKINMKKGNSIIL